MLGRVEFRVVNPELLAVAHRNARRSSFRFAPKLVWTLEPDLAGADDRFVQHLDVFFLLEVGLDLRGGRAFVADPAEQSFQIWGRKRFRLEQGSEKKQEEVEEVKFFKHFQVF